MILRDIKERGPQPTNIRWIVCQWKVASISRSFSAFLYDLQRSASWCSRPKSLPFLGTRSMPTNEWEIKPKFHMTAQGLSSVKLVQWAKGSSKLQVVTKQLITKSDVSIPNHDELDSFFGSENQFIENKWWKNSTFGCLFPVTDWLWEWR